MNAEVTNDVQGKLANAYLDSLKQAASFAYNDELLARPDSTWDNRDWIMTINGNDTVYAKTYKDNRAALQTLEKPRHRRST